MTVTAELGYARTGGWQTVVLPAKSGVEVLVLLPDGPLDQPHPAAFDVPGSTAVALSLPKVDVREKFELREALEQVGMGTMFSPDADLSGLSPEPPVRERGRARRPAVPARRPARPLQGHLLPRAGRPSVTA
ncbi:hypothetical protein ND450_23545 [Lentzea sp. HUAS12]|nr:hypothetical protein ND450_23545 [Lentzea sp. HUAS12]